MSTIKRFSRISRPGRYEGVSEAAFEYLLTGENSGSAWDVLLLRGDDDALRDAWNVVRDDVIEWWQRERPGRRPPVWWQLDAPAWSEPIPARWAGWFFVPSLREPRRRLGGIGTPAHEALNVTPSWHCGIPTSWVSPFDEAYYNGRARDIHGKPIGERYRDGDFTGLAPRTDDPPRFESQATYLDRHGLLTNAERRRLSPDDLEDEVLRVGNEDSEPDVRAVYPNVFATPVFDERGE